MNLLLTLKNLHRASGLHSTELILLVLFFILYSFGQLGRVEWVGAFYLHDIALIAWLIIGGKNTVKLVSQILSQLQRQKFLGLFLVWLIIGMTLSFFRQPDLLSWLYLGRIILYSVFIFSLFSRFQQIPQILKVLTISSGMYMVVFGLAQYILIPDSRYWAAFGWDDHYYRLIGPLIDPNLSGILYILVGFLVLSFSEHLPKKLWVSLLMLVGMAVVLTFSRATYLAGVVSLLFYSWMTVKKNLQFKKIGGISAVVLLLGIATFLLAPKPGGEGVDLLRTASITARIESTQRYLSRLETYQWLTGAGLYSKLAETDISSHARMPDNFVVLVLTSTGIVGAALLFTVFTQLISYIKTWSLAAQASLIAVLIHSQFNNSVLEPFIFLMLGLVIVSQEFNQKKVTVDTRR